MFSFQNYKDSNSLESGPSFQTKVNKFSSTRGSIQNRFGTDSSVTFENEPFGFRKGADIDFQSRVSSNNVPLKEAGGGQSKQNWVAHLKEKPVDIYKNTFNTLFSVVRQKHRLNYDTLKSSEKIIVSHHANIFKTTSHIKGETFVTLKDQNITESAFKDSERLLRPMIEQDVTHLVKDCINLKQGFYQEKLEYFVPPRGFIIKCKTEDDEFKIAKITNKLSNFMKSNPTKMNYKEVMPGTPSFLVFFTDDETEYFRVLIVGNPLGSDINNKVLVTLVDVSEKYFVDANVEDLYHLPSEVSFEKIKPNFIFATLYGINGISSQYQDWITRALDTNKKEVLLYFYPGNKNTDFIPTIDYLCCDEMGQRRWFSQLLKNEDEIIQFDLMDKSHLNIDFSKVSTEFDDVNFMQFKSFKKNLNIEIRDDYESSLDDTIEHFESLQSTEFNQVENGFLEHFETMLEEKKMKQLFLVIALVDDMINSESHGNWIKLREKMAKELKNSFNIII